ncbi:hypothetical protein SCP_0503010 [Sparassis crispa]|uniref:Uncharacterized protein n=1 Tax=Sparassis crispa TaxID=139825 RepID=A0A401GM12_9APHY|nr:hypothetical protein SCP_0503010 [Sparassis crispa]GBE83253.1 hypothetical protein SCP_0503010 [Sparassis crispa]
MIATYIYAITMTCGIEIVGGTRAGTTPCLRTQIKEYHFNYTSRGAHPSTAAGLHAEKRAARGTG